VTGNLNKSNIGLISALIYLPVSLSAGLLFFVAAVIGGYNLVARIGGAVWVLLLVLIITMPLITAAVKKRSGRSNAKFSEV
jgi:hypothetical protein